MTDQEKYYQYELQRRNSLMNYANSVGNMGSITAPVPGAFDADYDGAVDDLVSKGWSSIHGENSLRCGSGR